MQMPVFQSIARDLAERQEQLETGCCVGVLVHREQQPQGDPEQAPCRAEEPLGDPHSQRTGGSPGESQQAQLDPSRLGVCLTALLPKGFLQSFPEPCMLCPVTPPHPLSSGCGNVTAPL